MNEDLIRTVARRVEDEELWDQYVWTWAISNFHKYTKVQAAQVCPSRACIAGWTLYEGDRVAYERLVHAMYLSWLQYASGYEFGADDERCLDFLVEWLDERYGLPDDMFSDASLYHKINLMWTKIGGQLLDIEHETAMYTFDEDRRPADDLTVSEALQKWAAGSYIKDVWV